MNNDPSIYLHVCPTFIQTTFKDQTNPLPPHQQWSSVLAGGGGSQGPLVLLTRSEADLQENPERFLPQDFWKIQTVWFCSTEPIFQVPKQLRKPRL